MLRKLRHSINKHVAYFVFKIIEVLQKGFMLVCLVDFFVHMDSIETPVLIYFGVLLLLMLIVAAHFSFQGAWYGYAELRTLWWYSGTD